MKRVGNGCPGCGLRAARRQRGLSLIEVAVALIILGVAAAGFWQAIGGMWAREGAEKAQSQMARAEAAVEAFAGIHGRLPCPANELDGLEDCGVKPDEAIVKGNYPYATVGVPDLGMTRLKYEVRVDTLRNAVPRTEPDEQWPFKVLVNEKAIGLPGNPEATTQNLSHLVANTYDGILDLCGVLSRVPTEADGNAGPRAAFEISLDAGDRLFANWGKVVQDRSVISAAQVADHLGCGPIVAVSGRGQYNAHLSAAIMAKSAQDFRAQLELSYATYVLEVAEGAWSVANHTRSMLTKWSKFPQTLSAVQAKAYSAGLPAALATSAQAVVAQAMGLASWGARVSNLARFANNLKNYRDHLRIADGLVDTALANYVAATEHAMKGSTSAYFLREQSEKPVLPALPGQASNYGKSDVAEKILSVAQDRAKGLGHGDALSAHPSLPTSQDSESTSEEMPEIEEMLDEVGGGQVTESDDPWTPEKLDALVEQGKKLGEQVNDLAEESKDLFKDADDFKGKVSGRTDPDFKSDAFGPGELDPETWNADTYDPKTYDPKIFDEKTFDPNKYDWNSLGDLADEKAREYGISVDE